jgi:hypothetical protein
MYDIVTICQPHFNTKIENATFKKDKRYKCRRNDDDCIWEVMSEEGQYETFNYIEFEAFFECIQPEDFY